MSKDIGYMRDLLCKRIMNGTAGSQELGLLDDILNYQRRRSLLMGALCGAIIVQLILLMSSWLGG